MKSGSPRFSILLPTRNGGSHLRAVIHSLLGQTFPDLEVVVADNANTDETPAILRSIDDARLRVVRTETPISVTKNWMRALDAASGQYCLMLGDDDLLLRTSLEHLDSILLRFGDPDCVTFNGFTYGEPGAFSDSPEAYFAERHYSFSRTPHGEVDRASRRAIVRDMFRFRVRFPLNMQLTMFSSTAVTRVPGDFFRAPFPDHFALNALLLTAGRFVIVRDRLVVIGVSKKSFGHYFYSGRQAEGLRYLGAGASFPGRVDGSELMNSMYSWLLELKRTFPKELGPTRVSRWNYVARQANYWLREYEYGAITGKELIVRARQVAPIELLIAVLPVAAIRSGRRVLQLLGGRKATVLEDAWPALQPSHQFRSIGEFATWIESREPN